MKILFSEPYYGGSHRSFADGYLDHSRHDVRLLTMPARKWKWRMRGAAITMAANMPRARPDILLASDYLDLATLYALVPPEWATVPGAVYFHENQLTYPVAPHTRRDYQFGLTNITSCLAAERVFFNSHYHKQAFIKAVGELLHKMPDYVPAHVPEAIEDKSEVVPVGLELEGIDAAAREMPSDSKTGPLHIIWNHRWEFDKNPHAFYRAMKALDSRGAEFRFSVLGQAFRDVPDVFEKMKKELAHRIVDFGFVDDRILYWKKLMEGDVVVSTARHEFFGISVLEAAYAGCVPLLPNRLSYPELIPPLLHGECLYDSQEELVDKLTAWAEAPGGIRRKDCRHVAAPYDWEKIAARLDASLERLL